MTKKRLFFVVLSVFIGGGMLICPVVVFAEGVLEGHVLEIERQVPVEIPVEVPVEIEVPVNFSYPLETENYPDVPAAVGILSAEVENALSLEQQRVVSTAFRRVYQEQLNAGFTPGAPYDNKVRFAWGSDIESYMVYQRVGDGGDFSGEGLGLESLSILAMHPSGTQAFFVTDEFATLFYSDSGEEVGVQAYGYPVSGAYPTAEGRAQAFSKGLMTVTGAGAAFQSDEIEFSSPGNIDVGAIPDRVGQVREDTIEKYDRYARAAMTDAFRREWEQARIRGAGVGAPANNNLAHEWAGRDAAPAAGTTFLYYTG